MRLIEKLLRGTNLKLWGITLMYETVMKLEEIFNNNQSKRICLLGTTCCGKSTLQKEFPEAIDMDDALWPTLSEKEEAYICQKPWTKDIGIFTSKIVKERVKVQPGHPLFSLIVLDCDLIVYLNISDELLHRHCEKRGASFEDALNVKLAIENSLKEYKEKHEIEVIEIAMCQ